ncbi:uncharacterized protein [Lolium perenne]
MGCVLLDMKSSCENHCYQFIEFREDGVCFLQTIMPIREVGIKVKNFKALLVCKALVVDASLFGASRLSWASSKGWQQWTLSWI